MFAVNDVVVYRKEVFRIVDKRKNAVKKEDFFVLEPYIENDSLTTCLQIPAANRAGLLRAISTKQQIMDLIQLIPEVALIDGDSKNIESEYKVLMKRGTLEDLVSVMKTAYFRKQERMMQNKKSGVVDDAYFEQAERYLLEEVAVVMDLEVDEARVYINKEVSQA